MAEAQGKYDGILSSWLSKNWSIINSFILCFLHQIPCDLIVKTKKDKRNNHLLPVALICMDCSMPAFKGPATWLPPICMLCSIEALQPPTKEAPPRPDTEDATIGWGGRPPAAAGLLLLLQALTSE
jgi:hypothetical protein